MTQPFGLRAVEMHGRRMWERAAVERTLRFMRDYDLDTLVLHESDIVPQIVYPRAYFDPYALWTDMPSRRGENAIFNNRAYVQDLLRMAGEAGISVYLNIKEISFSDEVLSIRPNLFKDGAICPCEPFWLDYVRHKADELFTDFSILAGLIVSFGSQESRASKVQNRCRCERCREMSLEDWYGAMIACMHEPIARHGKTLAVRDFAYKPADHEPLVAAMERAPADVVFCIKAMPHDFYLTFPDNPAIGRLPRPQWIEYDVLGQFCGWGVVPCFLLDDLAERMPRWQRAGAEGVIFRIEWERINDLDSFDNISEANLIAAALLAAGQTAEAEEVATRWLGRPQTRSRRCRLAGRVAEANSRRCRRRRVHRRPGHGGQQHAAAQHRTRLVGRASARRLGSMGAVEGSRTRRRSCMAGRQPSGEADCSGCRPGDHDGSCRMATQHRCRHSNSGRAHFCLPRALGRGTPAVRIDLLL